MVVDALFLYTFSFGVLPAEAIRALFVRPSLPVTDSASWPHLSHEMPFDPAPPPVPKFLYRNGLQKEPPSTDRRAARSQKSDPAPGGGPVPLLSCTSVAMLPVAMLPSALFLAQ